MISFQNILYLLFHSSDTLTGGNETFIVIYIYIYIKISLSYNSNKYFINCRLVSAYEDKALGLSDYGEVFGFVANLTFPKFIDKVLNQNPYIVHPTEDH